jgi:hypothetical protein
MTDDLPGLVARLRERVPAMADRLPISKGGCVWMVPAEGGLIIDRGLILAATARQILAGVCAEVLAERRAHVETGAGETIVFDQFDMEGAAVLASFPDFTTALVSAVIALAEED